MGGSSTASGGFLLWARKNAGEQGLTSPQKKPGHLAPQHIADGAEQQRPPNAAKMAGATANQPQLMETGEVVNRPDYYPRQD